MAESGQAESDAARSSLADNGERDAGRSQERENEPSMSEATTAGWLTVSQAADRLQLSGRTVRRRCEFGRLRALLVTEENGQVWRIDPASCGQAAVIAADAADRLRTPFESEVEEAAATSADTADKLRTSADSPDVAALLAEKDARLAEQREEIVFLRERLREANAIVMRHAHALPVAQQPQAFEMQMTSPAPAQKPARPLWMVLLGWRPGR
jgi:hypothetical protein